LGRDPARHRAERTLENGTPRIWERTFAGQFRSIGKENPSIIHRMATPKIVWPRRRAKGKNQVHTVDFLRAVTRDWPLAMRPFRRKFHRTAGGDDRPESGVRPVEVISSSHARR